MYRFTEGQVDQMIAQVGLYRKIETSPPTPTTLPTSTPSLVSSTVPTETPTTIPTTIPTASPSEALSSTPTETDCDVPDDGFDYSSCIVADKCFLGDGKCDSSDNYNTAECNFDGGDCPNEHNIDCKISDRVKGLIKAGTRFLRK